MKKKKINCPICHSADSQLFQTIPNMDTPTYEIISDIDVSICRNCGMIFQNPCIQQKVLEQIYSLQEDKITIDNLAHSTTEAEGRKRLEKLLKIKPPPCRLLEVGCSDGTFLQLALEAGYQVVGLDPSRENIEKARSRYSHLDVRQGFVEDFNCSGCFDILCHFYVLEHALDPQKFLTHLKSLLEKDGLLFFEVPNVEIFSQLPFAIDLFPYQHISHFYPGTIAALLSSARYRVLEIDQTREGSSKTYGMQISASLADSRQQITNGYTKSLQILNDLFSHRDATRSQMKDCIEKWLSVRKGVGPVVIFGAGENGRIVLRATKIRSKVQPLLFCDNNPVLQGKTVDGLPVISPTKVSGLNPSLVIVASIDYQTDMMQQLLKLGVEESKIVKLYERI